MKNLKKQVIVFIVYWLLVVLVPIMGAGIIFQNNGSMLLWYLISVPLLLSFIPYKIAKIEKIERLYFIIFGSIIPLVILYSVIFFALREAIKNFSPIM